MQILFISQTDHELLKRIFISQLLFLLSFVAAGQVPVFRSLDVKKELPNSKIHSLDQDNNGEIWVGTDKGLWSFNGIDFRLHELSDSLGDIQVTGLHVTDKDDLIVGCEDGTIWEVKDGLTRLLYPGNGESGISSLINDGSNIIATTFGEGVVVITGDSVRHVKTLQGLPDDFIYCSHLDDEGVLWVGSDRGLSMIRNYDTGPVVKNFSEKDGLTDNIVMSMVKGKGDLVWLGLYDNGIISFNTKDHRFRVPDKVGEWGHGKVNDMICLKNEIWSATRSGIIDYEFSGYNRLRILTGQEGQLRNITKFLHGDDGNIWVTDGDEIYYTAGEGVEVKRSHNGTIISDISTILATEDGKVWYSSDKGLFCYMPFVKDVTIMGPLELPGGKMTKILSLFEDANGMIWVGTFDKGVICYDPVSGRSRIYDESDGLINNNVLSIDGGPDQLWFATLGGVSSLILPGTDGFPDPDFRNFDRQDGLGTNFIYSVFIDSRNRVWFGTDGNGVTMYDQEDFYNYRPEGDSASSVVYSITEDMGGRIWINCEGSGIYFLRDEKFIHLEIDIESTDQPRSVVTDSNGNLVVILTDGVAVVDPETGEYIKYSEETGLDDLDPDLNTTAMDNDGNLWVGSSKGIIKLYFEEGVGSRRPTVFIKSVRLYLDEVPGGTQEFGHDENHITFEYEGIWYADPGAVTFQYKLSGYNNTWITTRDRLVTFPNLPPGEYVFELRCAFSERFSDQNTVSYRFRISPPFWEHPLFLLAVGLLLVTTFYQYIRIRDRRMESMAELKRENIQSQFENLKNQVNPHFLFNSFNTLIAEIEDDKEDAIEYVNKLSDFFRIVLSYQDKDLIALSEEMRLVNDYLFLQHKRYGDNFTMVVKVSNADAERYMVPPLSLQLLLENCFKHNAVSSESPLNVSVSIENDYLVVLNNRNPRITNVRSTGTGLKNLSRRIRILANKEVIVHDDDKIFKVSVPLVDKQ
jgi:ligand-binding sensor domain-containing protein